MKNNPKQLRLILLGAMLFLVLHYPVISFFSFEQLIFGIPQLFIYLLVLWLVFIGLIIKLTLDIKLSNQDKDDE